MWPWSILLFFYLPTVLRFVSHLPPRETCIAALAIPMSATLKARLQLSRTPTSPRALAPQAGSPDCEQLLSPFHVWQVVVQVPLAARQHVLAHVKLQRGTRSHTSQNCSFALKRESVHLRVSSAACPAHTQRGFMVLLSFPGRSWHQWLHLHVPA